MKEGLLGSRSRVEITVEPHMSAMLGGRPIHPVYSTFWLASHAELAARLALEPYFDEGENAVGSSLSIEHEAMAAIGDTVVIEAEVIEISGRRVLCSFEARTPSRRIATGTQGQVVLSQNRIDALLREAREMV